MNRRKNIWIGLTAAAITFGSLYAFAGEKYFARHRSERFCQERHNQHIQSGEWYKDGERPAVNQDLKQ